EEYAVGREVRPGSDLRLNVALPAQLAGGGVEAGEHAVHVAGVDGPVVDADRGLDGAGLDLPLFLTGGEVEGVQVVVEGADVGDAVDDGGRAFDDTGPRVGAELDLPADGESVGQGDGGDAGLGRVAAEGGPIGGRGHGGEGGSGQESDKAVHRGDLLWRAGRL